MEEKEEEEVDGGRGRGGTTTTMKGDTYKGVTLVKER